jgi:hypothetical protein
MKYFNPAITKSQIYYWQKLPMNSFWQKKIFNDNLRDSLFKPGAAKLNIKLPTELIPNPKNHIEKCNLPTKWSILVEEKILQREFYTNNINIIKCEIFWNFKFWINK